MDAVGRAELLCPWSTPAVESQLGFLPLKKTTTAGHPSAVPSLTLSLTVSKSGRFTPQGCSYTVL